MMPKPKQSKTKGNFDKEVNRMSSERVLYESQPNMLLYSDNFIFKIIILFILVFMFSPILALIYRIQGTLQSNYQLQFINMTYIAELVLFLCILIIIIKLVLDYLDWKNTLYTLTDKRIIIKRGLFNKEKISMPYSKVEDIDVSQSIFERVLGAGDIVIYGGHDNAETILDEVPNPRDVEEIILNQVNNLNYSYAQGRPVPSYNNHEDYGENHKNLRNDYKQSKNNSHYNNYDSGNNKGYIQRDNPKNTQRHEFNAANQTSENDHIPNYNQVNDEEYYEEYEDNARRNDYVDKNDSNVHYFNNNDNSKYSGITEAFNDKKEDRSSKRLDKDELLSLNKRKFKKS